jgi:hypothetical protein
MAPPDLDPRIVPEIVDAAPPPSEWGPDFLAELRRLVAPLFSASVVASVTCSTS